MQEICRTPGRWNAGRLVSQRPRAFKFMFGISAQGSKRFGISRSKRVEGGVNGSGVFINEIEDQRAAFDIPFAQDTSRGLTYTFIRVG